MTRSDLSQIAQNLLVRFVAQRERDRTKSPLTAEELIDGWAEKCLILTEKTPDFDWGYWARNTIKGTIEFLEQCRVLSSAYNCNTGVTYHFLGYRGSEWLKAVDQRLLSKIEELELLCDGVIS